MKHFTEQLEEIWDKYAKPIGSIGLTAFGIEQAVRYLVPFLQTILSQIF